MMLRARQHEKNIQIQRMRDEKIENLKNRDTLFNQMYEKRA